MMNGPWHWIPISKLPYVIALEVHREGLTIKECAIRHHISSGLDGAYSLYNQAMRRLGLLGPMETITGDDVGLAIQRREAARDGDQKYRAGTPEWMRVQLEQERRADELERQYQGWRGRE